MKKPKCPECKRTFAPTRDNQVYCNRDGKRTCSNKAAARRLRERARKYDEMNAEQHGALGVEEMVR
jgi:hypothetical protein